MLSAAFGLLLLRVMSGFAGGEPGHSWTKPETVEFGFVNCSLRQSEIMLRSAVQNGSGSEALRVIGFNMVQHFVELQSITDVRMKTSFLRPQVSEESEPVDYGDSWQNRSPRFTCSFHFFNSFE